MNSILAVWFLSEKHSIYIELLLQERLLSNRLFAYFHLHSCHRTSKFFFQKCSLSLSHSLLSRIFSFSLVSSSIESLLESLVTREVQISPLFRMIGPIPPQRWKEKWIMSDTFKNSLLILQYNINNSRTKRMISLLKN